MLRKLLSEINNNDLKSLITLKIKYKVKNLIICPSNICLTILIAGLEIQKNSKNKIKNNPQGLIRNK